MSQAQIDLSAWGQQPPEFIQELARIVSEAGNNKAAADLIGINRASVSTLLANKYPAGLDKMERKIMAFCAGIECPQLGPIDRADCQNNRERPFMSSNPQRIALYRACRSCPHNPAREVNDD